jgi:hypothetical protein
VEPLFRKKLLQKIDRCLFEHNPNLSENRGDNLFQFSDNNNEDNNNNDRLELSTTTSCVTATGKGSNLYHCCQWYSVKDWRVMTIFSTYVAVIWVQMEKMFPQILTLTIVGSLWESLIPFPVFWATGFWVQRFEGIFVIISVTSWSLTLFWQDYMSIFKCT